MAGLDTTVRRLADLEAIRDLARRYAHCVWQKDADGVAALFAADGVMDLGDRPPVTGTDALRAEYESTLRDTPLQPYVHNHVVELDGDRATGHCYIDLRAVVDGESMIGSGVYNDEYVRVGDGWKFQQRALEMTFFVPLDDGWAE